MNEEKFIIKKSGISGYQKERQKFLKEDIAFRLRYDNDFDKYCLQNKYFITENICSPSEYVRKTKLPVAINDDISVEDFDKIITDKYNLWNYCLEDASEILERERITPVIPVKFSNNTIRLTETL